MTNNRKNLQVTKGYTTPLVTYFKNPDGSFQDLTGHTLTVKVLSKSGTVLYDADHAGTADGVMDLTITDEESVTLPVGEHVWHLAHDYPNGDRVLDALGRFTVSGGLNG